jgi:hypothetical protein
MQTAREAQLARIQETEAGARRLEAARGQVEADMQQRVEQERQMFAELEALRQVELQQLKQMAETEARLRGQKERMEEISRQARMEESKVPAEDDSSAPLEGILIPIVGNTSDVPPAILAGLDSQSPGKRAWALTELARSGAKDGFTLITNFFDDVSPDVRSAAARALYELEPDRPAEAFSRAIEEGLPERCRNIGSALGASGLAHQAIEELSGSTRERAYNALALLFVMAKTGEVQPLVHAIEKHQNSEVRRASVRLLALTGQEEVADAAVKRRLFVHSKPQPDVTQI